MLFTIGSVNINELTSFILMKCGKNEKFSGKIFLGLYFCLFFLETRNLILKV